MNNRNIIFEDFSNLDESTFLENISKLKISNLLKEKELLLLFNLEGVFISTTVKDILEDFFLSGSDNLKGTAIFGIGRGVRKLILRSIRYPLYIADNKEDGEDWLESQ